MTAAPPAPAGAAGAMAAIEARRALANMTPAAREEALADARDETVAAVLHAEHWRSGLRPEAIEVLRESWRRRRYPAEVDRLERLRRAVEDTQRGGGLLIGHCASLYDEGLIAAAEKTEREAAEALRA